MDRLALLEMVHRLGGEFGRRGMRTHVAPLRVYWLALRHGLVHDELHGLHVTMSEDAVVEWFKLLRLPPYQDAYVVRATGSECPACPPHEGRAGEVTTERTFPDGRKMACLRCRRSWLEMEGPSRLGRGSDRPATRR